MASEKEIPPPLLEKLLIRKYDALEREYRMCLNAKPSPVPVSSPEPEGESAEEIAPDPSANFPIEIRDQVQLSAPLESDNVNKIKQIMSGLSLKPPSWASAIPDEVLMSRVLGSIRSSHSSHSSTSTTSSSASSSATLSPPSSSLPVAAALSTSPDESPVFPTSAPAVVQPPFSQHAGVYLPWTCPLCTFVNRAFPSICETCESPNTAYAPLPFTSPAATTQMDWRTLNRVEGAFRHKLANITLAPASSASASVSASASASPSSSAFALPAYASPSAHVASHAPTALVAELFPFAAPKTPLSPSLTMHDIPSDQTRHHEHEEVPYVTLHPHVPAHVVAEALPVTHVSRREVVGEDAPRAAPKPAAGAHVHGTSSGCSGWDDFSM